MALQLGDGSDLLGDLSMGEVELIDDLADVGALPARYGRRGMSRGGPGRRIPPPNIRPGNALPARRLMPQVPGAPAVGLRLQPLGLSVVTFTATSGTSLPAETRPQRPFKGKRLVTDIGRVGVTAVGLITVSGFTIGSANQLVSSQPIGTSAFAANAFDTNMELSACTQALDITVNYNNSFIPTAPDHIDVATTIFGETIGS